MMKVWWLTSLLWIVLFGAISIFIWVREVDGSGLVQTPELRLAALAVLAVLFLFILICQLVFLFFALKSRNK